MLVELQYMYMRSIPRNYRKLHIVRRFNEYSIYHFTKMIIACFVESTHHAFQDTFPTEEILLVQFGLLDFTVSTMTT